LITKAVLFDMGETLIKYDVMHPGEVFQRILTSKGISVSLGKIKTVFLNAEKEAPDIEVVHWRDFFGIHLLRYKATKGHPEIDIFLKNLTDQVKNLKRTGKK